MLYILYLETSQKEAEMTLERLQILRMIITGWKEMASTPLTFQFYLNIYLVVGQRWYNTYLKRFLMNLQLR